MFSLKTGNWFLSPLYVLGSADETQEGIHLFFQRNLYEKLKIRVLNGVEELLLTQELSENTSEFRFSLKDWPKGEYKLYLEDQDKQYAYTIMCA